MCSITFYLSRKNYGPKGYGYGVGSGTLSMDDGQGYKTNPNEVDHRAQAYVAPLKKPLVQSNTEYTEVPANKPAGTEGGLVTGWYNECGGSGAEGSLSFCRIRSRNICIRSGSGAGSELVT